MSSLDIPEDLESVAAYFNAWENYQQIIQHNYMEHLEITQILHQYLQAHYPFPFSFLDLGCGDASFACHLLRDLPFTNYLGIDLAQTALQLAAENMSQFNYAISLKQQEILAFLASSSQQFDIILSAFSIHHLASPQKEQYFHQVRKHLKLGGVLLLVDVFRQQAENRSDYLQRYSDNIHQYWQKLTLEVKQSVIDHIVASDYPEWESSIREWAKKAGFEKIELLYQGGRDTQKILAMS